MTIPAHKEFMNRTAPDSGMIPPLGRQVSCVVSDNFRYYDLKGRSIESLAEAVRRGMRRKPRSIPPRFLYDSEGSRLFERICSLPEYYQTRTEIGILSTIRHELARFLHGPVRLVELGSGASVKTRIILDALSGPRIEYVPIDISNHLEMGAGSLASDYPALSVTGIMDTYENGLGAVREMGAPRNLVVFFGSSLGNLSPAEADEFLRVVRISTGRGGLFLLGLDMIKDSHILEAAYNDSQGMTARFILNIISRMNRDLGADFDPDGFSYYGRYNGNMGRVEMYVKSMREQMVDIPGAGMRIRLERGEMIHVENSYKYTIPQIRQMARRGGFAVERLWLDEKKRFSLTLLS